MLWIVYVFIQIYNYYTHAQQSVLFEKLYYNVAALCHIVLYIQPDNVIIYRSTTYFNNGYFSSRSKYV